LEKNKLTFSVLFKENPDLGHWYSVHSCVTCWFVRLLAAPQFTLTLNTSTWIYFCYLDETTW